MNSPRRTLALAALTVATACLALRSSANAEPTAQAVSPPAPIQITPTREVAVVDSMFLIVRASTGEATPVLEGFVKPLSELVNERRVSDRTRYAIQSFTADSTIASVVNRGDLTDGTFAQGIVSLLEPNDLRYYIDPSTVKNVGRTRRLFQIMASGARERSDSRNQRSEPLNL